MVEKFVSKRTNQPKYIHGYGGAEIAGRRERGARSKAWSCFSTGAYTSKLSTCSPDALMTKPYPRRNPS